MDIKLAGTRCDDLESLSKYVETNHPTFFSLFKEHCGTYVPLENSFLVDSINSIIVAGSGTSFAELQSRTGSGDNYLGALFLTGLETLWRKKEEELQKQNANIVNPPALPWFADYNIVV